MDDNYVYQSVPDNYIAWSVGGAKFKDTSGNGAKFYGKCSNSNSLSIELCDTNRNGSVYPTQATINRALELTKTLMKKYSVPVSRVIRHYDVNAKGCPAYWVDNTKWEREFHGKLATTTPAETSKKAYNGVFPVVPPSLKKGSKGSEVKHLQSFLNWYENYGLVVDGDFGNKTKTAVINFQKMMFPGVPSEWDGIFGKKSLEKAKTVKK